MTHPDKIIIKDLLLRGIIGLNDWEREVAQDILINLTLFTDMQKAGESDNGDDILNYRTVTKAIMSRSARILMEGWVRVPADAF